jgi:hypothetical protein
MQRARRMVHTRLLRFILPHSTAHIILYIYTQQRIWLAWLPRYTFAVDTMGRARGRYTVESARVKGCVKLYIGYYSADARLHTVAEGRGGGPVIYDRPYT